MMAAGVAALKDIQQRRLAQMRGTTSELKAFQ
jgi:hypothetical protein